VTVSGTPISLGESALAVGTSTVAYIPQAQAQAPTITTLVGQAIGPLSNGISIAGTTLTPGGPAVIISRTPISLGSSALAVGASTVAYTPPTQSPAITSVTSQAIQPLSNGILIAGITLTPGAAPTTIS